jgi:hypothetical protein
MHWETSSAKGSGINYIGNAESNLLPDAMRGLWIKYLADAAPVNANIVWDHLRVELWIDSGRIIIFPARSALKARIELAVCQMFFPSLQRFYENLIGIDLADDQFESTLEAKEKEVIELVSKIGSELGIPERLERPFVRVLYFGTDLQNPMKEDCLIRP